MDAYMSCKDTANRWGISPRRVAMLCQDGRVAGAVKIGRTWAIPRDTPKPEDARSGPFVVETELEPLPFHPSPLPVGHSDFKTIAQNGYYWVDKTLFIRDLIDAGADVTLICRPRRFGKTLNMTMLRAYFERSETDAETGEALFRNTLIWGCGERYRRERGRYPVIWLSLKDAKGLDWNYVATRIKHALQDAAMQHDYLMDSTRCRKEDKVYLGRLRSCSLELDELGEALLVLSRMLRDHHGIGPLVLIDEYDTPVHNAYLGGFYSQAVAFLRTLFGRGLKDNPHRSRAVLTGVLRVAKESLLSGLNNLDVSTVLDERYSAHFGFTADEVRSMARYYGATNHLDELYRWYDGYRFGRTEIFNPWSVINYLYNGCAAEPYWHDTGDSSIIADITSCATPATMDNLRKLLDGSSVQTPLDLNTVYPSLKGNPSSIYSFLLMAGYLKATDRIRLEVGTDIYTVSIPNLEIRAAYRKEVLSGLDGAIAPTGLLNAHMALLNGDARALQDELGAILLNCASFFDTTCEAFYHGLLLGLCAMLEPPYRVTSNREAGIGRYDICLTPRQNQRPEANLPGIVIEIKANRDADPTELETLAHAALAQIEQNVYAAELGANGATSVLAYGMAFSGKQTRIAMETMSGIALATPPPSL